MALTSTLSRAVGKTGGRSAAAAISAQVPVMAALATGGRRSVGDFGGIRIIEERERALETLFAHQEDERLIRKMIENNPDLDPNLRGVTGLLDDGSSLADKIRMIFIKHGIPPANQNLINDLVSFIDLEAAAAAGRSRSQ
eukprot:TRINITY_DN6341_c0_g1_i1.p1 TRINITY_DN6341_c0_g1~~TRINITY_DN6341_c0_g1_i1.p1  ORF type:complete len:140 (-),score=32.52 TRINITY_DN6341_c0_g1_i1:422-841(-)